MLKWAQITSKTLFLSVPLQKSTLLYDWILCSVSANRAVDEKWFDILRPLILLQWATVWTRNGINHAEKQQVQLTIRCFWFSSEWSKPSPAGSNSRIRKWPHRLANLPASSSPPKQKRDQFSGLSSPRVYMTCSQLSGTFTVWTLQQQSLEGWLLSGWRQLHRHGLSLFVQVAAASI